MNESMIFLPDSNLVQDLDDAEYLSKNMTQNKTHQNKMQFDNSAHVKIQTIKVCTQEMPLPDGVDVVHASRELFHFVLNRALCFSN